MGEKNKTKQNKAEQNKTQHTFSHRKTHLVKEKNIL